MAGLRQKTQGLESMTPGLPSTALRKVRSPPLGKMMVRSDILESSRKTLALLQSHSYELCETPFHPQTLNNYGCLTVHAQMSMYTYMLEYTFTLLHVNLGFSDAGEECYRMSCIL